MGAIDQLPPPLKRHRLRADEYQQLGRTGIIGPELRVELLDGEIIEMAPIGTRHWAMVNRLDMLLKQAIGKRAIVSSQSSFRLDDYSEPEPDLALFKWRDDFYATALPTPADTLLLIEVSDSSLRYDREIKLPRYARRGVPEVWIVDLEAQLLRVHREPNGDDFLQGSATATPGIFGLAALPGVPVDLTGLFG
ncbi:MAG TPA: Uma2 family endonuclease [Rubrivivax sp.]|nr:Uma2 family endonuclease [Rubrivivax sp.]